ncbi:tryptophan 7-halogenase [Asaia sp. HN010]|uniref:NAD(P)/FAD-dependent oxidoreductase n=1 Tax=Asaia sp. HN010 TaxID=3081233 RepID=UPI003019E054
MSENFPKAACDVLIIGAGLAGLTLAKQLLDKDPTLDICIVHNRKFPCPEHVHKVGESTIEIGAYYLADTIGCRDYLQDEHLRKMAMRFIQTDSLIDEAPYREIGVGIFPQHVTFQIDRGKLENHLRNKLGGAVKLVESSRVLDCEKQDEYQIVSIRDHNGNVSTCRSRWVIDASGRGRVLMKKLGLQKQSGLDHSAVWFRVGGKIDINDFIHSSDESNPFRDSRDRRCSTTHLAGNGYWVWIIPINEEVTSIGIVFDNSVHSISDMSSYPLSRIWLSKNEPRLQNHLDKRSVDILDFGMMRNYSYIASKYISSDGWALTGEAAGFIDPLYSSGTDLIALANTMITNVITRPDGLKNIPLVNRVMTEVYASYADTNRGVYPNFGNWNYLFVKTNWDTCFYFMSLPVIFLNGKIDEIEFFDKYSNEINELFQVHGEVTAHLRKPEAVRNDYDLSRYIDLRGSMIEYAHQIMILDDKSDKAVAERLRKNIEILREMAKAIIEGKDFDEVFYELPKRLKAA